MKAPSMVFATVLLLCGGPWLSAQQAAPDPPPQFRSGVEVVNIDVNVIDKQGLPLRGLAASDFTVTVGGQPRRVVTADYVDTSVTPTDQPRPADIETVSSNEGGGTGRLFAFIVDQSTLEPGNARHVATAASRFFSRLTYSDRSALMLLPVGPNVPFTWAHDRVREGLLHVTGLASPMTTWEYGSLSEARDIANRNLLAVRSVGERECRSSIFAGGGGFGGGGGGGVSTPSSTPSPTPPPSGGSGGESGGGGSAPTGGSGGSGPSGSGAAPTPRGGGGGGGGGFGGGVSGDACLRGIQMQAEAAWRDAQMTSLASIAALRQILGALGRVQGDKTVILISGGWPLEEREEMSVISTVAAEAAAVRATVYTVFVPSALFSADRRGLSSTPARDQYMRLGPLETLAGMTGGGTFRADVNAETTFQRISRELAGYYRIGVERDPLDATTKARHMKVQVTRSGLTVRARDIFDVRTYEDRDRVARLASALESPVLATGVGVRMTSYLAGDPEKPSTLKVVLAGEGSRLQPGEATYQLLIRNLDGNRIVTTEQPLGDPVDGLLPFSTNVSVPPGVYIVRFAIMDNAGHVGAVERRIDARETEFGELGVTGPLLVRVPNHTAGDPRLALDGVGQNERLALELDLEGEAAQIENSAVKFEIASKADGPALLRADAAISPGSRSGLHLAQAVADMRVLPPGQYILRTKLRSGNDDIGEINRPFAVVGTPRITADSTNPSNATTSAPIGKSLASRIVGTAPPFAIDQVLAPPMLEAFLSQVSERPDASSPVVRDLLDRARTVEISELKVSDAEAAQAPIAAFLQGLTLLAQNKLDPAANAFRGAMRASPDFYPAMVYLGACYAAAGNDKEAAGAWRTALIREGDAAPLHLLLADAFLRQGRGDLALQTLQDARTRWPEDTALKQRYVLASLQAGQYVDGLQTVDELVDKQVVDDASLALALLVLYESIVNGPPVQSIEQDRARMTRLADVYRSHGGPSVALVDTWVAAAMRKQ
jgi:VWFA-related protein